jgi:adenosine kinase
MSIIVTGTIAYDYIMDFNGHFSDRIMPENIGKLSLSFLVDKLNKQFGGTAGNIGYSLNLLGAKPLILAPAGNDFDPYQKFLTNAGIDISGIKIYADLMTSSYFVVSDSDHNQIGSFYLGATKNAAKVTIAEFCQKQKPEIAIISPTDPIAMKNYVEECIALKIPYIYDPAFQIATFTPDELRRGIENAKILIGNDYEISLIEQKLGISHEELIISVPHLITTIGSKGSIIETRNEAIHINPAKIIKAIDPTGAGDAYRSGFIAGFIKGYDLVTCGQMGSISSVFVVEKSGTVNHTYTQTEFIQRYTDNYGGSLTL